MRKISTLQELRNEKRLLNFQRELLEAEIKKDLTEIREELKPLSSITKLAGKFLVNENGGVLGNSAGKAAEYLTKNVFMRNSGWIARLIVPFLAKKTASKVVEEHKPEIMDWIGNLVRKFREKREVEE